jgi:DNA repair exonuclease SbcCD ATPase subunit
MQFDAFLSVIDLLKDTKKYEDKITELKAREQAIQDSITKLGVVGDIAKAKSKAESLLTSASDEVAKAKAEADKIVADARIVYEKRHSELQAREVVADQALANYNTIRNQLASREHELRTQEKAVEALRSVLEAQQAKLTASQLEVDERLAKLRGVMG